METLEKDPFKIPLNPCKNNDKMPIPSKSHSQSQIMSAAQSRSLPAAPTKRIINKIPLDFNKLKQAGLDRQLAEALSKRNSSATKKIASATTTSTAASTPISAAAQSTEKSVATNVKLQRGYQPAPAAMRNQKAANVVAVDEQSMHIKALIKHKILNKLSKSPGSTTTTTKPSLPEVSTPTSPGSFTVHIPKADLTARTKAPLLLNSVNQLPKHRARCGVSRPRPPEVQATTAVVRQEKLPSVVKATPPQIKRRNEQSTTQAPPPLIVLENKVLSPDEKIDLSVLRLPKMQSVSKTVTESAEKVIKLDAPDNMKVSQEKLLEKTPEIPSKTPLPPKSAIGGKKVILSAKKLKMSREKLVELAKEIQNQAMQKVKQSSVDHLQPLKPISFEHKTSKNSVVSIPTITKEPNASPTVIEPLKNEVVPTEIRTPTEKEYALQNTTLKDTIEVTSSHTTSVLNVPQVPIQTSETNTSFITPAAMASPLMPSPSKEMAEQSSCVLSAVDFIAQLTANDSNDSTDFLELSPEELSMTQRFSSSQLDFMSPPSKVNSKEAEEEFPIGKILQLQDMDILHATLSVDENKPSVLCISPNAVKLQNSMESETKSSSSTQNVDRKENIDQSKCKEPESSFNLSNSPIVFVTTPRDETKNENIPEISLPDKNITDIAVPDQNIPVTDIVGITKKEEEKPLPRLPFRPKKGKINLVQRNKRANVVKPAENIAELPVIKTDHKTNKSIEASDVEGNNLKSLQDTDNEQPLKVTVIETQKAITTSQNEIEDTENVINRELTDQLKIETKDSFKEPEKDKTEPDSETKELVKIPDDVTDKPAEIPHSLTNEPIKKEQNTEIEQNNVLEIPEITNNNIAKTELDIKESEKSEKSEKSKPQIVSLKHKRGKINLVQRSKRKTNTISNKTETQEELCRDKEISSNNEQAKKLKLETDTRISIDLQPNKDEMTLSNTNSELSKDSPEAPESNKEETNEELNKVETKEESENQATGNADNVETICRQESTLDHNEVLMTPKEASSVTIEETQEISQSEIYHVEVLKTPKEAASVASEETEKINQSEIDHVGVSKTPEEPSSVTTEETQEISQSLEVQSTKERERDLSQLYNPPKMSRRIKNNNNNDVSISKPTSSNISLLDILSQDEPPPQGEAVVPFRQEAKSSSSVETSSTPTPGIQNLLGHLAAENVVPSKAESNSNDNVNMEPPKTESTSEKAAKMPRKKLVKTRPVLSAKRPSKAAKAGKSEAVHPRKRALLAESTSTETQRSTTSSTSDDDAGFFRGFDNETPSCSKLCKMIETDISDDATPDYDETEDDQQPDIDLQDNQAKADNANNVGTIANLVETVEEQKEDVEKQKTKSQAKKNVPIEISNYSLDADRLGDIPKVEPVTVKKKRGRSSKNSTTKSLEMVSTSVLASDCKAEDTSGDKTVREENATIESVLNDDEKEAIVQTVDSSSKRQCRRKAETQKSKVFEEDQQSTSNLNEVIPATKRKRQTRGGTPKSTTVDAVISNDPEIKPVKRRGRRAKSSTPTVDTATPVATPDAAIAPTPDAMITSLMPKKRGRKPKSVEPELVQLAKKLKTENDGEESNKSTPGWPEVTNFNLRLLLIRKRDQLETDEELRENGRGEGALQCGLCLVRCDEANWKLHLGEHYGIGWPMDNCPAAITRHGLLNMMINYVRAGVGNKRLTCRLCNRQLGSGLGMLLHLEGCGAQQARIECDFCKQSYSRLSIQQHVRSCFQRSQLDASTNSVADSDESSVTVFSNAGRAKRRSTIKAETKLQNIAKQLEKVSTDGTAKSKGSKDFEADSSDYDITRDKESSEEYDSEGADSNEDSIVVQTDEESVTSSKRKNKKKRTTANNTHKQHKILYGRTIKLNKVVSQRWKYFVETNYTKDVLYSHLLPRYVQLSPDIASEIMPTRESQSMRYAYGEISKDWMQLQPLESFREKNEHISYLGSPIKELAWAPLPPTVDTQYLLCSLRRKVHGYTRLMKDTKEDALLMLFKCKLSDHSESKKWPMQTELQYGIRVPQETVHSFAFMPSGGYDKAANRLGLLAVGTTSGAVIYALPLKLSKDVDSSKTDKVIELQPVLTFILDIENPLNDPCTKICWSESCGHNLLVTGYASGNVALWDISDEQGLNFVEINNERHVMPANYFYFGERNIHYLELHYDSSGPNWLAVGSSVRKLVVYDISNWSQPLAIVGDTIHNLFMGDLCWPSLWESVAVGSTELSRTQFTRFIMLNPSGITYSQSTFDVFLSSIRSIHFNYEQLALVSVTDNGDVIFLKTFEFNMESVLKKRQSNVRYASTTEAKCLDNNSKQTSVSPDTFKQDYGLQLKPITNMPNDKTSKFLNLKRHPSFDLRSLLRLNCVRWNWNTPARNWVAVGAEHGLLRIINFETDKHF